MTLTTISNLPDNPEILKKIIADQHLNQEIFKSQILNFEKEIKSCQQLIKMYEESIAHLKNKLWGQKTEKIKNIPDQPGLFDEAEVFQDAEPEEIEEDTAKPRKRKKTGRKAIPAHFPRIEVVHDIPAAEKQCCGQEMAKIGEEISEKLDVIPAKIQVIRNIRYKYCCKVCEGTESETGAVKIAPKPAQLIEKGILTERFISRIITAKFADGLPYYRQEKIWERHGLELSRATMSSITIKAAEACKPIINLLYKNLLTGPLIGIDETPVQVLKEEGRSNTTKSYMWVFLGGSKDRPVILFQYRTSRSGKFLKEILNGYQGYVQTDGYCGYDCLEDLPNLKEKMQSCFAHARRKFMEVTKACEVKGRGNAGNIIGLIKQLYAIEAQAREENMTVEQIYEIRQERAKPILEKIKAKIEEIEYTTPPSGLLGKAISYARSRWRELTRYIENGNLSLDNNLVENAIRPFAIGRKNWLFFGHPNGAEASANLYSLIETAKANGLEPNAYLNYLFEKLPLVKTEEEYLELLPNVINPEKIKNFSMN